MTTKKTKCGRVKRRKLVPMWAKDEIVKALRMIHGDGDYDGGMRLLCKLARRKVVKTKFKPCC